MGIPAIIAAVLASYLLGAVPVGYLVVKALRGQDIRTKGSGNIGATNAARVLGKQWFFVVYFIDFSKGLLPCLVVGMIESHAWGRPAPLAVVLCGLAAVVGHIWPVYLGFRGGKGVATSCGVCTYLFPGPFLAGLGLWIVVAAIWRYVSLASLAAAVGLPAYVWVLNWRQLEEAKDTLAFVTLAAVMVIVRHRGNVRRLLSGTEHKIGQRAKVREPEEPDVTGEPKNGPKEDGSPAPPQT